MACPYFVPVAPHACATAARSPLGRVYAGDCGAPGLSIAADAECCNFGYARGLCPAFPEDSAADAVRFSWRGGELIFILERDYAPVEHGPAAGLPASSPLARQAAVFASHHIS